jgi:hypothetical protein
MNDYPRCTSKQLEIRFVIYHYPDRIEDSYVEQMKADATAALMQRAALEMEDCHYQVIVGKWLTLHEPQDPITLEPPRTYFSRYASLNLYSL